MKRQNKTKKFVNRNNNLRRQETLMCIYSISGKCAQRAVAPLESQKKEDLIILRSMGSGIPKAATLNQSLQGGTMVPNCIQEKGGK